MLTSGQIADPMAKALAHDVLISGERLSSGVGRDPPVCDRHASETMRDMLRLFGWTDAIPGACPPLCIPSRLVGAERRRGSPVARGRSVACRRSVLTCRRAPQRRGTFQ